MLEAINIFWAFQLAVLTYVITCVLMTQDYLLEWYLDLLLALENRGELGKWFSKPLGLCEKCTAGQIGLWVWLVFNYSEYLEMPLTAFLRHIIFMSFVIVFVTMTKNIFAKWK